jgi:hypothetical protein
LIAVLGALAPAGALEYWCGLKDEQLDKHLQRALVGVGGGGIAQANMKSGDLNTRLSDVSKGPPEGKATVLWECPSDLSMQPAQCKTVYNKSCKLVSQEAERVREFEAQEKEIKALVSRGESNKIDWRTEVESFFEAFDKFRQAYRGVLLYQDQKDEEQKAFQKRYAEQAGRALKFFVPPDVKPTRFWLEANKEDAFSALADIFKKSENLEAAPSENAAMRALVAAKVEELHGALFSKIMPAQLNDAARIKDLGQRGDRMRAILGGQ